MQFYIFLKNKIYRAYKKIFFSCASFIFNSRYKTQAINIDSLKNINPAIGALFLSNHSSSVDALFIIHCLHNYQINGLDKNVIIWSLDATFKFPFINLAIKDIDTVHLMKVPNINTKRLFNYKKKIYKLIRRTVDGLYKHHNFIIFPSGHSKTTPREELASTSAVHSILQQCPHANLVLVRIQGQWGSRFSWAAKRSDSWKNETNTWIKIKQDIIKVLLRNLLFFIPKRKVTVEFLTNPIDFPRNQSRYEINRYLENYYNKDWGLQGEPVNKVSDYFWKDESIVHEARLVQYHFDIQSVNEKIKEKVINLIARRAQINSSLINFDMDLKRDLGFDSLEVTELLIEIEKTFEINPLVPDQISNVGTLIALIANLPVEKKIIRSNFNNN